MGSHTLKSILETVDAVTTVVEQPSPTVNSKLFGKTSEAKPYVTPLTSTAETEIVYVPAISA
jgi:hypothetical protein